MQCQAIPKNLTPVNGGHAHCSAGTDARQRKSPCWSLGRSSNAAASRDDPAVREHWALFLIEGASFGIARRDSIAARGVGAAAGWRDWRP
jgi:hypothetical protein